jgi:hypothetical protein
MGTEPEDGRITKLTKGTCYFIGDSNEVPRSLTTTGCKFIVELIVKHNRKNNPAIQIS